MRALIAHLRHLGHHVTRPSKLHARLLVDGAVVEVRCAAAHRRMHRVKAGGRVYQYLYQCLLWNLHVHGRRVERPAFWVLLTIGQPVASACVVPGDVLRGKTYSRTQGRTPRRSRFVARYAGAWGQL